MRRTARRLGASLLVLSAVVARAAAQEPQQSPKPASPLTTVHGLVRNGASGQPLPRALVRINGDAASSVLTDGEGRFEFRNVPEGPQDFTVLKPGFMDENEARADSPAWTQHGYGHNVMVISHMGNIVFTMQPVNSIRGQIQLSTGDIAEGIPVLLLRRTVQDGRAVWQSAANTKTNSEGVYRFGELADGLYAVRTESNLDTETATNLDETPSSTQVERQGYASVFFPDARDLAGAAKIHLANGEQAQANISLTLEPFHRVTASLNLHRTGLDDNDNVSVQIFDAQGHALPYPAQYDPSTRSVQTALPDGTYSLVASLMSNLVHVMSVRNAGFSNAPPPSLQSISGDVSFSVAGRAISTLRIPISPSAATPIQVTVTHGSGQVSQRGEPSINISLSEAGGSLSDGMVSSFAEGRPSALYQTGYPPPGSYWAHTNISDKTYCESSFTAGGASLAREPLVINSQRTDNAPLVLTLRDDCAKLTLILPASVGVTAGEERSWTVYVVPDFDSTQDVIPQTLRPSTGGRMTIDGLTPGNYHVYAFDHPSALEYRNPNVLASIPGQSVSLSSNAEAELTVEVPQP